MSEDQRSGEPARDCPACGKRLSRFNRGPLCFACQPEEGEVRRRPRRARLPYESIVQTFREVGDTTEVARRLELPRSSVWYVLQRARRDGVLPDDDARRDQARPSTAPGRRRPGR